MTVFKSASYYQSTFKTDLQSTCVWAQLFALYCIVMYIFVEPTVLQTQWADPILKIAPIQISAWFTIVLSIVIGLWSFRQLGLKGLMEKSPFVQMATGVLTAIVFVSAFRLVVGDTLPDFVPAEESSKPGLLYSMVAGYGEEVYFRMLVTPLVFFFMLALLKNGSNLKLKITLSAVIAILVAALAFVLSHEAGEADGMIVWKLVATRFIMPGVIMGSLYFIIGPGFVIFMHATMHILMPLVFI
jgi:hypothetical protein